MSKETSKSDTPITDKEWEQSKLRYRTKSDMWVRIAENMRDQSKIHERSLSAAELAGWKRGMEEVANVASDKDLDRWEIEQAIRAKINAAELPRPCTCHPDDNPPIPCPQKFALSECRAAAALTASVHRAELVKELSRRVAVRACEIPDRDSPEDQPEMLLLTTDELRCIVEEEAAALERSYGDKQ